MLTPPRVTPPKRAASGEWIRAPVRQTRGLNRQFNHTVVRHLGRRLGTPKIRPFRRIETPPGVQAQHDGFEVRVPLGRKRRKVQLHLICDFEGTLEWLVALTAEQPFRVIEARSPWRLVVVRH